MIKIRLSVQGKAIKILNCVVAPNEQKAGTWRTVRKDFITTTETDR